MAALERPYWEAVTPASRDLLLALGHIDPISQFYLAGGTALALRMGHRVSVDLDLFAYIETLDDPLRREIVAELDKRYAIELLQDSVLGLVLTADGQPASFFSYGYPLLDPADTVGGVRIAGIPDIGLMKLDAVAGRGTRKDFYDLYCIASHLPLDELFACAGEKYAHSRGFGLRVLAALVDFDAADQQEDPVLLQKVEWAEVKAFFETQARQLGKRWLDDG